MLYSPCVSLQPGSCESLHLSWLERYSFESSEKLLFLLFSHYYESPSSFFTDVYEVKNGLSLLQKACIKNDILLIACLLKIGCDANIIIGGGLTLAHISSRVGGPVLLSLLDRYSCDFMIPDGRGRLPIHHAVECNNLFAISWLIYVKRICPFDAVDEKGVTPLHLACSLGNFSAIRILLKYINHDHIPRNGVNDLFALDSSGNSCLHFAFTPSNSWSTASAISVQCDRAEMILWPLLTWRLPHHDSGYPYLPLSHLLHHRNSGGQTAIDLARNLPAPKRLIYLLKFAVCQTQLPIGLPVFRILCSLFSSNLLLRLSFFNRIYSAVWWIHALAPLLFTFLTYSTINSPLTDWTTSSACLTGLFGLASLICLQRHRMADGTRRANPVYIGYLVAGFLALLTSYWNDLLPALSKYSIAARLTPFGVWLVSLITSFWCLLFIKLALLPQPDLKVDSAYTSEKFASLAAAEASHVISRVEGLATCIYQKFIHSDDGAMNIDLLEYLDKEIGDIARLYCPECHLIRPSDHNVKHCRLCDTCCFDFDHHCIFLMRCVTRSNQATFILFLFVSWIGFAFYVSLAFLVLSLHCICGHSVSLTGDWKISCLVLVTPRGLLMLLFSFAMTIWLSFFLRNQQIAYRTSKSNNNIGLIRQMLNQCGFARLTAIFCSSGRASPLRLV